MNDQLPPGAVLDKDQLPPGAVLDENQLPPGATIDINPDPAAEAAFDRARGVPLYTFAPGAPPQKELPPPGEGEGEPKKDIGRYGPYAEFGKQLEAGYYGGLAPVDRLTGGIAHLLDTAATKISGLTGLEKNGLFKQIEDWAKEQQKYREEQAAELAGGRRDLSSQLTRGAVGAVMSLPVTAAATTALGPVGGMATLGALETADQGPGNMLKGAAEGALMGKFLHVLGPYGRPIRIPAVAGAEYVKNIAQGVDPETALANALNMGALTAIGGPGTKKVRNLPGALPETLPESLRFKPTLNPVQQRAVDYLKEQGVPLTGFQQTGNRFLGGIEATTAHTPLGSQRAREFHAGTQEAMADLAGELAGQVHAAPVTKYEGGKAAADALDRNIASLHAQETDAYGKAWQHAGKPEFDKNVVVKTETEPLFDEAGEPTGERQVPTTKDVNMPVDVRWMKEIARDEIPNYRFLSAAEQSQSKAYSIYKNLLKMDDYITAQQAEKALQGLKSEAGYNTDPNLRNESQAASARVIPRLQRAIDAAVAETGPDAVAGLQAGRRLHAEKEGIAEISKKLRDEPVQAFNQLAMAHDAGVDFLKAVAKEAPDAMPKVGRAYLDHLFDQATNEGGWMRADGVFKQWDNLGPQTKALLFPNEGQVRALDRFFLASKITAERINTSGTQLVKAADDAGINALKWFKGKVAGDILFSPRGIKFLTGIAQNPPRTSAQTAALKAQAEKVFGPSPKKPPDEPPPPAAPPTGGGPTPSPTGGGGGTPPSGTELGPRRGTPSKEVVHNPNLSPPARTAPETPAGWKVIAPGEKDSTGYAAEIFHRVEDGKGEVVGLGKSPEEALASAHSNRRIPRDSRGRVIMDLREQSQSLQDEPRLEGGDLGLMEEIGLNHAVEESITPENARKRFDQLIHEDETGELSPATFVDGKEIRRPTPGMYDAYLKGVKQGAQHKETGTVEPPPIDVTATREELPSGAAGTGSLQERLQTLGDEALDRVKKSGTFQGRTLPSLFPAEVTKDMATWGAARIANGAIEFGKWSKAMLDDAQGISPEAAAKVRAMLPQLYKDSQKEYEHHLQTIGAGNIADLPTIMKYYRAGKEGKQWYNFVKPALQPLFGQNTDLFLKMFAATSPNTKVTQNVLNAVKAYRQFLTGEPFTGMPAHVDNLNRAVAGVKMSGPKVGAFGPNLLGNLTPVTVDLWMARAILGRDTVTPLQSKLVDYMTSQAAKKVGLEPAEMQAAIWTGIKKLQKSRDTSAPPEVIVKEYLDKNPETRKLFEDSLEMSKEHFQGLQSKQAPAKPPRN